MAKRPRVFIDSQLPLPELFAQDADVTRFDASDLTRARLADADALIVRSVNRVDAVLLEGTPVRFVGTATSGIDHVDIEYLKQSGVAFADAKGANAPSVAQYVFACLALYAEKVGRPIETLTLGIIGFGHVGSLVGRLAIDVGMQVLASDPVLEEDGRIGPWSPLPHILKEADVITLHVPLEDAGPHPTINLIDTPQLSGMRNRAGLINTSRGGVVNESALRAAVSQARHAVSAYVDVWLGEPDIDIGLARQCEIATPHIAGYSIESKRRAVEALHVALKSWLAEPQKYGAIRAENAVGDGAFGWESRRFAEVAAQSFPVRVISQVFLGAAAVGGVANAFASSRQSVQSRSERSSCDGTE